MKEILFAAALAASLVCSPALAQVYLGGSLGKITHHQNRNDWRAGAGFDSTFKDTDTSYKLYAGYQLDKNFGFEGGYYDFGRYKARIAGGGDVGNAEIKTDSWNAFAVGTAHAGNSLSAFGKVGVTSNRSTMSFASAGIAFNRSDQGTARRTSFAWGVGGAYSFNKNLDLRLEFEDFGKAGETNNGFQTAGRTSNSSPRGWSLGLKYGF